MNPAERVKLVLKGELVDKIPFTVYASMLPQSTTERFLRSAGVCILKGIPCHKSKSPNCRLIIQEYEMDGRKFKRETIETPLGEITSLFQSKEITIWSSTWWCKEYPFKKPEDYKLIKFCIEDKEYLPNYESIFRMKKTVGNDVFLWDSLDGYSPLQHIIMIIMGIERFSIEWAERRDEVLKLYEVLISQRRKLYPILAKSPISIFKYGGNVVSEVIGRERFKKYVLPHYDEFAEILHKEGKLMGVHFDGNCELLKEEIASSKMDFIEAFTPYPDCDMSMEQARKAWPDKVLWINFPSSVHLASAEIIEETTKELIHKVSPGDKFLISITEDVPEDRWQDSFLAISRAIDKYGRLPVKR